MLRLLALLFLPLLAVWAGDLPHKTPDGYALPNGWSITPIGKAIVTGDMVLNVTLAPDGKAAIAMNSGYNPHSLTVIDANTQQAVQHIQLKSTWLGLAWSTDGKRLYASGGNANGAKPTKAPVYVFGYNSGRLTTEPIATFIDEDTDLSKVLWSGLAQHPKKPLLFAANRGTNADPGFVVAFDVNSGKVVGRIPVEVNPYDMVFTNDGRFLYVSNWASASVSIINTETMKVAGSIRVGSNPNDMELADDGRLFVACSNDNSVYVIDTHTRQVTERISTTLTPHSPEGSTPDALAIDARNHLLFVANADNNDVAVIHIAEPGHSDVLGFLPAPWYPSALAFDVTRQQLYIGSGKGLGSYSDIRGPHSPLPPGPEGNGTVKTLQKGSVNIADLKDLKEKLPAYTKQVFANTPYRDEFLAQARRSTQESIVPRETGAGSPIKHVIYIIKENRTYDQVFGDMVRGNGDPRLTIFGRQITPNHHALADQFVLLDNLFADGEVSVDGHSWSNSAYATDFNEKLWPITYARISKAEPSAAYVPAAGRLWDLCQRKGLTYRSYGEYAARVSTGDQMDAAPGVSGLIGHVSPHYRLPHMRDTDNAAVFIKEFDQFEANYDSKDPNKRLPNFIVMSLPEDHTAGTTPGRNTPRAMVANNDLALGMIVERVSHSKYWRETAIFVIEDDAQDGADHVDARRTVGLVISPFVPRETVDSTLYTTSSMVRTIELLLGLPPMSQYDAAAMPMYASLGTKIDLRPYNKVAPLIDVNEKNTATAWGARESMAMDFSDVDRVPMHELNEIIWRSVRGASSPMPAPVHRYRPLVQE
jgi:YVTN family beta-propeller protein